MFDPLAQIHDDEKADVRWSVVTVSLVLAAHSILETARDTLFLTHLPATRLPWVYLALAVLALLATRWLGRSHGRDGDLRQLVVVQWMAAAGTAGFLVVTSSRPAWALYALYVWGGLASTLILLRFWLLLTDRFTVAQAKRLFPFIAAGPLLGSLVGYGAAGVLAHRLSPAYLLGVSAFCFGASAVCAGRLRRLGKGEATAEDACDRREAEVTLRESLRLTLRHHYMKRVVLLLLAASVTVTIGDFIFKSVVAHTVGPAQLGSFLAASYFAFDLLALLLLVTAVAPFVRTRGVTQALALQPVLMLGSGVVLTVFGGLLAVLCLRGIDGVLRWSLHKTATELLYVPLSARLRSAVKGVSDVVSHRGGQALGSLVILAWLAVSPDARGMGPVVIACAAVWVGLVASLRQPYLDLFRASLGPSIETQLEFPDLDIDSLETLIQALGSESDDRVLAAMDVLDQTERVGLIPALILYHPSAAVVVHALDLFAGSGRRDFGALLERLLSHPEAQVRAAAMRTSALLHPDLALLRRASESESLPVAVTALVALAAHGGIDGGAAAARLEPYLADDSAAAAETRTFIARALRDHPATELAPLLSRLAAAPEAATRLEAARAMGVARDERHLPILVGLLARRDAREGARRALVAFGEAAFEYVRRCLEDLTLPRSVRVHLPRTLSRFPAPQAAEALLQHLLVEPSGTVRFKILRGLGRLVADHPDLALDPEVIDEVITRQLAGCYELLEWSLVLERAGEERAERHTPGYELLVDLLRQKEDLARERLFRALGLRYPHEDLARVHDGLASEDGVQRASGRELLLGLLPADLRDAVVGLVDEAPASERLRRGHAYHAAADPDFETLLRDLVGGRSVTLCCVASYYVGELGLSGLRAPVEAREVDIGEDLASLRLRSLEVLTQGPEPREELRHGT